MCPGKPARRRGQECQILVRARSFLRTAPDCVPPDSCPVDQIGVLTIDVEAVRGIRGHRTASPISPSDPLALDGRSKCNSRSLSRSGCVNGWSSNGPRPAGRSMQNSTRPNSASANASTRAAASGSSSTLPHATAVQNHTIVGSADTPISPPIRRWSSAQSASGAMSAPLGRHAAPRSASKRSRRWSSTSSGNHAPRD